VLAEPPGDLVAIESRHGHVEDDEVGCALERELEGGLSVRDGHDLASIPLEPDSDEREDIRVVVSDEDERASLRDAQSATASDRGW
jgi:hypothetical protein